MFRTIAAVILAALLSAGTLMAGASQKAIDEVRSAAKAGGLGAEDGRAAVQALSDLVDRGVPVDHALAVVRAAINRNSTGPEIAAVARSMGEAVESQGSARDLALMARNCLERGLSGPEVARVMSEAGRALAADIPARQLRVLAGDLLDAGIDGDGLAVAIEAVLRSAESGLTPEESRKAVALAALNGLKNGLRGEALAAEIRKEAQRGSTGREEAEGRRERGMPDDVRDRIRAAPEAPAPANTPRPR